MCCCHSKAQAAGKLSGGALAYKNFVPWGRAKAYGHPSLDSAIDSSQENCFRAQFILLWASVFLTEGHQKNLPLARLSVTD